MASTDGGFGAALALLLGFDAQLWQIVLLSLQVSLLALLIACLLGLPAGAALAVFRFHGRRAVVVLVNTLMGLPPVVVGLLVYLALSRSGPLGELELLFTPSAMVIAQTILIFPIVTALTRQVVENAWQDTGEHLRAMGAGRRQAMGTLLWETRGALATAAAAGFGRAIAEVGAVIIVGGNIAEHTRVMTTTIALETSKGNLALAIGLGMVLLLIALVLNGAIYSVREFGRDRHQIRLI